ncbi:hypothetical protein [Acinetobacter venetianus]|uniref:hypothetical protein n=1 Tax=Acinetobacter venetianus TaxID=52133 RepID=UPI003A9123E9
MTHKCYGQCPEFKGEQCNHCLIDDSYELKVNDIVVFVDSNMPHKLMTVSQVSNVHDGVMLNKDRQFTLTHLIRPASTAEKKIGHRLQPPALLFVEQLPICNEARNKANYITAWDHSNV